MKIALFGGSFDPPHTGHEKIVRSVLANLNIDLLVIMPTFLNPFKEKFSAPPNLRLKWVEKLWGNLEKVRICDFEILQNEKVPSIKSVNFLLSKYPKSEIYLIIGADNLANLDKWHKFDELKNLVKFVVFARGGVEIPNQIHGVNLQKMDLNVNMSSSFFRSNLKGEIPNLIKDEVIKFYGDQKMSENSAKQRAEKIAEILNDKKAENVEIIDMSEKDYIAKFVVIATTLTGRHGLALIDELKSVLKPLGEEFLAIESSDEWSVVDLGDIIIHLMDERYRAKYNIEEFLEKLKRNEFA